jgi:hypothetical protein
VSKSNINAVVKYIENQEAHHRKISFEDEFIALLENTGSNTIQDMCSDSVAPTGLKVHNVYPSAEALG